MAFREILHKFSLVAHVFRGTIMTYLRKFLEIKSIKGQL